MIDGENAYDNENVKKKMFFLPDDPFYTARTTPRDLLHMMNPFYNINEVTYFETLDHFKIPIQKRMDKFSKGMKRQVFISLAFAIRPKYMLLDEAFDGLDPLARIKFKEEIKDMVEKTGSTVIISSHSLKELEDLCDAFAILNNTTIVASGSIKDATKELHKYQIAFKEDVDIHFFPRIFKTIKKDGRVIRLVSDLDLKQIEEKLKDMNPVFIDELPIEFEEFFTAMVENGGRNL
jgi:ABC-2 type transport system ATP-binding protein